MKRCLSTTAFVSKEVSQIKEVSIYHDSYDNMNNLAENCEYLRINKLKEPLKNLPVWVVIRLCTDDDKIVNYWNNIDSQLELEMDILDDLCGEAEEIATMNPWLTYGEPMHRLREFGISVKEIDLLDESKLNMDQIQLFASIMYKN